MVFHGARRGGGRSQCGQFLRRWLWRRLGRQGDAVARSPDFGLSRQQHIRFPLHGAEPLRSGKTALQVPARTLQQGLGGHRHAPDGALHEHGSRKIFVPGDRCEQLRHLERAGGESALRVAAALLPDELVLRPLRDYFSGTAVDGLPVPCPATPEGVRAALGGD